MFDEKGRPMEVVDKRDTKPVRVKLKMGRFGHDEYGRTISQERGEIVSVPGWEAKRMIAAGHCDLAKEGEESEPTPRKRWPVR